MAPKYATVPFSQVAKDLEVTAATVYRWALRGVRGVRLQAQRVGGRWATKDEWVQAFLEQLNSDLPFEPSLPKEADAQFHDQAEHADRVLRAMLDPKGIDNRLN